jgi:hypothetical protein
MRTNRQIDTDHRRPRPAIIESKTIQANGGKKLGITLRITRPASTKAKSVVPRNTSQPTMAEIHVAGEEKKETAYGESIHIRNANPPSVNKTDPHNLRRRSAILRSSKRAWKRAVKPGFGPAILVVFNILPVSAKALQ